VGKPVTTMFVWVSEISLNGELCNAQVLGINVTSKLTFIRRQQSRVRRSKRKTGWHSDPDGSDLLFSSTCRYSPYFTHEVVCTASMFVRSGVPQSAISP
jgi:hypothetical protein